MRGLAIVAFLAGCGGSSHEQPLDAAPPSPDAPDAAPDHLKGIFDEVDGAHVVQLVKDMSYERYSDAGRQKFRDYWSQAMTGLGLTVNELDYQATGHPRPGIDLEAVLPGATADSFVVIVHYDSMGPPGQETTNPGADDDMTGMAIELETARIFAAHRTELTKTVRFVASDEEELGGLAGARAYAAHIQAQAQASGFHITSAVDDEQTGWNCHTDGLCEDNVFPAFDVFSCGSSQSLGEQFDYPQLGDAFQAIVAAYSPLSVVRGCMGAHSDHFAMWEIGVPTLVFSEHDPFDNPHFDQTGGDTFDKIDGDYLVSIARPAITFQATLAGITK